MYNAHDGPKNDVLHDIEIHEVPISIKCEISAHYNGGDDVYKKIDGIRDILLDILDRNELVVHNMYYDTRSNYTFVSYSESGVLRTIMFEGDVGEVNLEIVEEIVCEF